jgi:hypothetical protein
VGPVGAPGSTGAPGPVGAPGADALVVADLIVTTLNVTGCIATPLRLPVGAVADFTYDCDAPSEGFIDVTSELVVRGTGMNSPGFNVFRDTLRAYEFEGSGMTMREVFVSFHIPHSYRPEAGIFFHVHWAPNAASPSGNITWHFAYSAAKGAGSGTAFGATSTVTVTEVMPGTQYLHRISEIGTAVLGGGAIEVDALVLIRIYRDAGDASDTSTDSAYVFFIDAHVPVWKVATRFRNKDTGDFYG